MLSIHESRPHLEEAWIVFHAQVAAKLRPLKSGEKGEVCLIPTSIAVRTIVEELESEPQFDKLVEALKQVVEKQGFHTSKNLDTWKGAVKTALRRSGYYLDPFNPSHLTGQRLVQIFEGRGAKYTHLSPLQFLHLPWGTAPIVCKSFEIRKFTQEELDALLQTEITRNFYTGSMADTELLSRYWFLIMSESYASRPLGKIPAEEMADSRHICPQYTQFPQIESALYRIALCDWRPWHKQLSGGKAAQMKEIDQAWQKVKIPFLLTVSDNLLDRPSNVSPESVLDPDVDLSFSGGEIRFDHESARHLAKSLEKIDELLSCIDLNRKEWAFLTRGLGFLLKEYMSEGLEQLLWHMVTLEAIVGEDKPGITKRLCSRIASVFGKTPEEQKKVRKILGDLYKKRSQLVHGNEFTKPIMDSHLTKARDLARGTVLWMIQWAADITRQSLEYGGQALPGREELLALLDLDHRQRESLVKTALNLPTDFPHCYATRFDFDSCAGHA